MRLEDQDHRMDNVRVWHVWFSTTVMQRPKYGANLGGLGSSRGLRTQTSPVSRINRWRRRGQIKKKSSKELKAQAMENVYSLSMVLGRILLSSIQTFTPELNQTVGWKPTSCLPPSAYVFSTSPTFAWVMSIVIICWMPDETTEGVPVSLCAYYKSCWEIWSPFFPGCPPGTHTLHLFH